MTEKENELVAIFEDRLRKLVYLYKNQKENNRQMQNLLEEKEIEINRWKSACSDLEKEYNHLKLAKIISLNDSDIGQSKERLSKLVREIDQCIALLNE